jgi:phosphate transport system substrate-binding protein
MNLKLRHAVMAVIAAASAAPMLAFAAPDPVLYGGGATLPADAFVGPSWITGKNAAGVGCAAPAPTERLSNTSIDENCDADGNILTASVYEGSFFWEWTTNPAAKPIPFPTGSTTRPYVSYCQTGSGGGKAVLTGGPANNRSAAHGCGDYGSAPPNPQGFSGDAVDPDFAATDSPINSTEYGNFITNKGPTRTEPVQVPVVAGAIAVVFRNSQVGGGPSLTTSEVCRIFSGAINNWSQLGYPAKPIQVVYRSDSSGTSFGYSNHLSAVCPTALGGGVAGFSTNQVFTAAFPGGVPPAGAIGQSGNGGVVNFVNANDGSIGYAELSDAIYGVQNVEYFKIARGAGINPATTKPYKKKDPLKLAKSFALAAGTVQSDKVVTGNDANGRPILGNIAPAPAQAGCVQIVDPAGYASSVLVNGDYKYYPIMAVSYLVTQNTGHGDNERNVESLFASWFGAAQGPSVDYPTGNAKFNTTTIAVNRGFSYLSGFPNPTNTVIKPCIKP